MSQEIRNRCSLGEDKFVLCVPTRFTSNKDLGIDVFDLILIPGHIVGLSFMNLVNRISASSNADSGTNLECRSTLKELMSLAFGQMEPITHRYGIAGSVDVGPVF